MLRSQNGGLTWAELGTLPTNLPVTSVASGGSPTALFAAVFGAGVYRYDSGSSTWNPVGNLPLNWAYQVGFDSANRLLCLVSRGKIHDQAGAGLYRWSETGATWTELSAAVASHYGQPQYFHPLSFTVHPTAPDTVWLCTQSVAGGPSGAGWVTDNASDPSPTWSARLTWTVLYNAGSRLEDWLNAFSVAFDPSDLTSETVYAATLTHGIWTTGNASAAAPTWTEFKSIPFVASQRLTFTPADPGTVYIGTFGGGAWRTMTAANAQRWQQRIRRGAYQRYLDRRGGPGSALGDWLAAQHDVLDDAIRTRAYQLYERRGRRPGRALDDWLRAQAELVATLTGVTP